jgi:hypothetical protein
MHVGLDGAHVERVRIRAMKVLAGASSMLLVTAFVLLLASRPDAHG